VPRKEAARRCAASFRDLLLSTASIMARQKAQWLNRCCCMKRACVFAAAASADQQLPLLPPLRTLCCDITATKTAAATLSRGWKGSISCGHATPIKPLPAATPVGHAVAQGGHEAGGGPGIRGARQDRPPGGLPGVHQVRFAADFSRPPSPIGPRLGADELPVEHHAESARRALHRSRGPLHSSVICCRLRILLCSDARLLQQHVLMALHKEDPS